MRLPCLVQEFRLLNAAAFFKEAGEEGGIADRDGLLHGGGRILRCSGLLAAVVRGAHGQARGEAKGGDEAEARVRFIGVLILFCRFALLREFVLGARLVITSTLGAVKENVRSIITQPSPLMRCLFGAGSAKMASNDQTAFCLSNPRHLC